MLSQTYNWKRFWYTRGSICRPDYAGYLDDPESEYGHFSNPDVVTFESIAEIPCLVLLGEPGIGKSTAIKQAFKQIDQTAQKALWFDLGEYQTDVMLRDEVFKNDTFQDWLGGAHRLHLFLDSLGMKDD
jgi:predicted NACHT family NTPase